MPDLPPAQYDHAPRHMIVHVLSRARVESLCGRLMRGEHGPIIACTVTGFGKCVVLLPENYQRWLYRHERAHCNGWKH